MRKNAPYNLKSKENRKNRKEKGKKTICEWRRLPKKQKQNKEKVRKRKQH